MRMRKKKHTDDRMKACGEIQILQPTLLRGKWHTLSEGRPLHLEIGCGKGSFICETAKRHPEAFFIAVEKVRDVLVMAMEKAVAAGLTNVVFADMDAEKLADVFADGELSVIYLNFSDPWPKKKHAARRLTHTSFLKLYRQILSPEGMIYFKTDNRPLFDFSLEEMRQAGYELSQLTYDLHRSEYADGNVMTEYERAFSDKGFPIHRVAAHPMPLKMADEPAKNRKAYLFDMDGTLVDSMGEWVDTMLQILREDGISYPQDIIARITPLGNAATAKLFSEMGVKGSEETIMARMEAYALTAYKYRIVTKPYVADYLRKLKAEGAVLAVLTASPHVTVDVCLKRNGIFDLFDRVWTVSDLGYTKSQPEIYRAAAERLGVLPEETTFFDDNLMALTAAKDAGLSCVGVFDPSSEAYTEEIQKVSGRYIRSFEELL